MHLSRTPFSRWATRHLARALAQGCLDDAVAAIQRQANPNIRVPGRLADSGPLLDLPALFVALVLRHTPLIEGLLEARASVDDRVRESHQSSTQGWTVLDAVQRQEDLLRLLRAGLMWHQPCGNSWRDVALHVAASRGWPEAIAWLAQRGADLDVRNGHGQTPLHAAVRTALDVGTQARRQATIRHLVRSGSALELKDHQGRTPAQTALLYCPELLPVLVECGAALPECAGREALNSPLSERLQLRVTAAADVRRLRQQLDQYAQARALVPG